ncbi:MAG TPA: EamA family transporter [Candidatus Acidoferrales bacterium]|nr:EamA family transporter [Candidatus Acidoferrales bacterium]
MLAPIFALGNAFFFAVHNVLTKKALRNSNPTTAVTVSLFINAVFLWLISLLFIPLDSLATPGIFIFVFIGLFQPGLTRLLTYKGIEHLGVAITDPIRATTPLFSALMAVAVLGEKMTLPVFCGTLLVVVGIWYLSQRPRAARPVDVRYIFYPLLASVLAGFSQVLRKVGLGAVPHPILAAAVTASSSFAFMLLGYLIAGRKNQLFQATRQSLPFLFGAGIAISIAMVCIYYALDLSPVVVVIPLSSTGPLFALALASVFLRESETVTLRIVTGACLIVFGVVLLTVWKA